jgi:hypothetical protein
MIVGLSHCQFVLASAVFAATILFGSEKAQAGYISFPEMAEQHGDNSPVHSPLSQLTEFEASTNTGGSSAAMPSRDDADRPNAPSEHVPPSREPSDVAHNFGYGSGAGSSSGSSAGNGPPNSLVGDLPALQDPRLALASLLSLQAGDPPPFCVVSLLFRPPRSA